MHDINDQPYKFRTRLINHIDSNLGRVQLNCNFCFICRISMVQFLSKN